MDSPYSQELKVALAAVQGAARLSQHIISSNDKGTVEKDDLSPVTIADFAIQALLTATLKNAFPEDKFVGEEDASDLRKDLLLLERVWELLRWLANDEDAIKSCTLPASRVEMCDLIDECGTTTPGGKGSGRTWVFDPIDGTKTFVRGELYAINVALLVDGEQTASVVGCPNLSIQAKSPLRNEDVDPEGKGCIVFGVKDHGSYIRELSGQATGLTPRRLALPPIQESEDLKFSTCVRMSDSDLPGVHKSVATRLNASFPTCDLLAWVLRWTSMALGLGNANVWVYKHKARRGKVWDHAGAMLLFEEAGGMVTDVLGNSIDLTSGRKMVRNFGFIAAPKSMHPVVLKAVHDVLESQGHGEFLEEVKSELGSS